ncbi:MAG: hypothetical protein AAGC72_00415 [Planctomycetota bacterium]
MYDLNEPSKQEQAITATAPPLACLPSWVTPALVAETQEAWTPIYGYPVTEEEAVEIIQVFNRLTEVLADTPIS